MNPSTCTPSALEVGNTIRKLRIIRNYKQAEFADKIGMCPEGLSKIENGKTDISLSRLCAIANAFDVDITILFSDSSDLFK